MKVHHLKTNRTGHILRLNGPWISIKVINNNNNMKGYFKYFFGH